MGCNKSKNVTRSDSQEVVTNKPQSIFNAGTETAKSEVIESAASKDGTCSALESQIVDEILETPSPDSNRIAEVDSKIDGSVLMKIPDYTRGSGSQDQSTSRRSAMVENDADKVVQKKIDDELNKPGHSYHEGMNKASYIPLSLNISPQSNPRDNWQSRIPTNGVDSQSSDPILGASQRQEEQIGVDIAMQRIRDALSKESESTEGSMLTAMDRIRNALSKESYCTEENMVTAIDRVRNALAKESDSTEENVVSAMDRIRNALAKEKSNSNSPKPQNDFEKSDKTDDQVNSFNSEQSNHDDDVSSRKDSGSDDKWECRNCLFPNPTDHSQCILCATHRYTNIKSSSIQSKSDDDRCRTSEFTDESLDARWECSECLFANPLDRARCILCEAPRCDH